MLDETLVASLAVETTATAIAYATLGALARVAGWRVGVVLLAHAAVAALAYALAGRSDGLLVARALVAAEAVGAAGLGALLARLAGDSSVGAALATGLALTALFALPLSEGFDPSPATRGRAAALSPLLATARAHGVDALRLPVLYRRAPSAVREYSLAPLGTSLLLWALPGALLLAAPLIRRSNANA
ncbi:MAG: hypothetical protein EXR73_06570 [Myxococcales bacterium]|nr:hypothetical protein [Myxococcales bacterium]